MTEPVRPKPSRLRAVHLHVPRVEVPTNRKPARETQTLTAQADVARAIANVASALATLRTAQGELEAALERHADAAF